ncbi:MAG: hypothetical protein BWY82_02438 [Verrucomicrobia bacterium ADurb.Bin474]|nr:MAG: hypothetical protein BWY82_02438 [Verrucomicrobia bacterium ADurb.Bin474]
MPIVETDIPSFMSERPSCPSSPGVLGPTLASPSESRMIRLIRFFSANLRTSAAPLLTPANSAVLPSLSI